MGEVLIRIRGKQHYLWRAVAQNGNVLDTLVQSQRSFLIPGIRSLPPAPELVLCTLERHVVRPSGDPMPLSRAGAAPLRIAIGLRQCRRGLSRNTTDGTIWISSKRAVTSACGWGPSV